MRRVKAINEQWYFSKEAKEVKKEVKLILELRPRWRSNGAIIF